MSLWKMVSPPSSLNAVILTRNHCFAAGCKACCFTARVRIERTRLLDATPGTVARHEQRKLCEIHSCELSKLTNNDNGGCLWLCLPFTWSWLMTHPKPRNAIDGQLSPWTEWSYPCDATHQVRCCKTSVVPLCLSLSLLTALQSCAALAILCCATCRVVCAQLRSARAGRVAKVNSCTTYTSPGVGGWAVCESSLVHCTRMLS